MIGHTFLHYQIVERLGQGGMGAVYKARDTHLDRYVAIKVLPHDKVADPERRRRFIQEAKAASALNHPNIITIHDIDEAEGVYFIAMEYVEGKTLHEMIKRRDLQLKQIFDYTVQIAGALSKAHSAGIIHRDLKPSNVMVTPEGLVKVLDFGLAKLLDMPTAPTSTAGSSILPTPEDRTDEGTMLGTLFYMSPEQARGQEVDHRTDIFSLGVVLYQMVAGELPFFGPHAVAVLDKLLYSPTPSLKSRYPDIPDVLEKTVARATAKDPGDRYQSMKDLIYDLNPLSEAPVSAAFAPAADRDRREKRRPGRRLAVFAVFAVLLALLLAIPFRDRLPRWLGGPELPKQMRLAVLPFTNVGGDLEYRALCDGMMDVLVTKLIQVGQFQDTLSVVSATEVRNEKVTSASGARRTFGANLALTGSIQKLPDKILLTINLEDTKTLQSIDGRTCMAGSGELFTLMDEAFEKAVAMLALKVKPAAWQALSAGETKIPAAYSSYLQAIGYLVRFDKIENVDKAIDLFQQAVRDDPQYALAYAGLGEAYWRKFRNAKETTWADAALSSCNRAAELDSRVARVHTTLGMIYTGIGRPEQAVIELKQGIAMEPRNSDAYRELGRAYEALNRMKDAGEAYQKAVQLQPESWSCVWDLGVFYSNSARYPEAAAQFLEVLRLAPDHYRAYSSLGAIYVLEGKYDQAVDMFHKSLAIKPSYAAYSNLAAFYLFQRRFAEAVAPLEKATAMEGAGYEVWGNLADAYFQTPVLAAKAPAAYERASELAGNQLSVNPKDTKARASLAFYRIRLGDKKRALEEIERAGALAPEDPDTLFWTALVYELAGNRQKALDALAAAAAAGYSQAMIRAVSDLDELRKDPRYRNIDQRAR